MVKTHQFEPKNVPRKGYKIQSVRQINTNICPFKWAFNHNSGQQILTFSFWIGDPKLETFHLLSCFEERLELLVRNIYH